MVICADTCEIVRQYDLGHGIAAGKWADRFAIKKRVDRKGAGIFEDDCPKIGQTYLPA